MVIDVTYTYDDYTEANAAHVAAGAGAGAGGRQKARLFGWVVFVGLAILFFLLLNRRAPVPVAPARGPGPAATLPAPVQPVSLFSVFLPLLPWLLVFGFIWFFVFRQLRALQRPAASSLFAPGSGRPDPSRPVVYRAGARSTLTWLIVVGFALAALVLLLLNNASSDPGPAGRSPALDVLLPVAPYFLMFVAVLVVVRRGGVGVRRLWDGQPHLQRPKRVEIDVTGFVISDAVSRLEHRWPSFSHARETKNLFLLYVSNYAFHMVPKRAFATDEEADGCRELVRKMVAERPGPAFPVLPATAQATS